MKKADILAELHRLALSEKSCTGNTEWIADDTGKSPVRRFVSPLAIDNIVYSGLTLQIVGPRAAPADRPFFELRANLQAVIDNKIWHLGRIEFDPGGPPPHHVNPFSARSHAPQIITGPHHHSFADNERLGVEPFEPTSNLPVALAEDSPFEKYSQVLDTVSRRFLISGFWTEDPKWLLLLT